MSSSSNKKTVLVTGAGAGIGNAIARLLAEKDWIVFAGVRKEQDIERLRSQHTNIKPVILDVTIPEQVTRAAEEVRSAVGAAGLDCLVNNAGIGIAGPSEYFLMSDIINSYEVNVFGVIRMIQATMPMIRQGKPGRVINIGSVASEYNLPYVGMYQSTKSALLTLSESFRREVSKWNIKVVLIQPGGVRTNFEKLAMNAHEELKKKYPPGTDCYNFYGKDFEHFPVAAKKVRKYAVAPELVANRVYQTMVARNPKNIICDTWRTYFTIQFLHWATPGMIDSMTSKLMFAKN